MEGTMCGLSEPTHVTHVTQGIWSLRHPLRLELMSPACSHNVERVNSMPSTVRRIVIPSWFDRSYLIFLWNISWECSIQPINTRVKHIKKHFRTPYPLPLCVCKFNVVILSALPVIIQSVPSLIPAIFHPLVSTSLSLILRQVEEVSASIRCLISMSLSKRIKY